MNAWEKIELEQYEKHMSLDSVYQLQTMNQIMKQQFNAYNVKSIMILGIAGGNGLEHIDASKIQKVYGVDINKSYLAECAKRFSSLTAILETICVDLMSADLKLPYADLVVANLLIEYIGYAHFQRVICSIKPKVVSCAIQVNTDDSFVSDSPYLHAFDELETVHHQIDKEELTKTMKDINYHEVLCREYLLPNGKKLVQTDFIWNEQKKSGMRC